MAEDLDGDHLDVVHDNAVFIIRALRDHSRMTDDQANIDVANYIGELLAINNRQPRFEPENVWRACIGLQAYLDTKDEYLWGQMERDIETLIQAFLKMKGEPKNG